MALGLELRKTGSRVFCILGDGELQEGSIWESAMSAGANRQNNLTAIVDRNRVQLDGPVEEIMKVEPLEGQMAGLRLDRRPLPGAPAGVHKEGIRNPHRGPW